LVLVEVISDLTGRGSGGSGGGGWEATSCSSSTISFIVLVHSTGALVAPAIFAPFLEELMVEQSAVEGSSSASIVLDCVLNVRVGGSGNCAELFLVIDQRELGASNEYFLGGDVE
jgi:hypothetical protein